MKPLVILSLAVLSSLATAQELPVGSQADNVEFALFENELTNRSLADFEGQIIALYYYTPW